MTVIPVLVYLLNTSEELLTYHLLTKYHIQRANVNCLSSERCDTVVMYLFCYQTNYFSILDTVVCVVLSIIFGDKIWLIEIFISPCFLPYRVSSKDESVFRNSGALLVLQ